MNVQELFQPHKNRDLLGLASIVISPTDLCNRQCFFCPRVDPNLYPNRNDHMSVELATKLATELDERNYQGLVSFSGYGEPLLNPNIGELIKAFTSRSIDVRLISNSDRIYNGKITIEEIDTWGLLDVKFNCYDGGEQYIAMVELCKNMETPNYVTDYKTDEGDVAQEQVEGVPIEYISNRGGSLYSAKRNAPCYQPMYKPVVDWNGDVYMCCEDWIKEDCFGNIQDQSFSEVWMSDRFVDLRFKLAAGDRSAYKSCANCNMAALNTTQEADALKLWNEYNV